MKPEGMNIREKNEVFRRKIKITKLLHDKERLKGTVTYNKHHAWDSILGTMLWNNITKRNVSIIHSLQHQY